MKKEDEGLGHSAYAKTFNEDEARVDWHDETLWFVREKRDKAARQLSEWEELREAASQIKTDVLDNLRKYLLRFESHAISNGAQIHWASTPDELNSIVAGLITSTGETKIVKSKSMLTEECGLNPYLQENGIEVIDTDLGERIVQLAGEHPSHIVLPCIHKKKEEI